MLPPRKATPLGLVLLLSLSPQPQLTVVVVKYSSVSLPFFCLTVTSICAQLPFQQLTWHEIGLTTWGGNLPKKGNRTTPKKEIKNKRNFYPALLLSIFDSHGHYKKIQIDRIISQKPKVLTSISNSQDGFTNFLQLRIYEFSKNLSFFIYSQFILMERIRENYLRNSILDVEQKQTWNNLAHFYFNVR